MKKSTDNKGFSLVELIIVIAIMAILVGMIAIQIIPYIEKTRESRDLTTMDTYLTTFTVALAENDYKQDIQQKKLSQLPTDIKKSVSHYLSFTGDEQLSEPLSSKKANRSDVLFSRITSGSTFVVKVEAGQLSVDNHSGISK